MIADTAVIAKCNQQGDIIRLGMGVFGLGMGADEGDRGYILKGRIV